MSNLSPYSAAEMVATGEGYAFYLPGELGGKLSWAADVKRFLMDLNENVSIGLQGSYHFRLGEWAGDVLNRLAAAKDDSFIIYSVPPSNAEYRQAIGIATITGKRLVVVDDFLSESDRKFRPEIVPVEPVSYSIPAAIIVDLDGTLADSSHRDPYGSTREEILRDKLIEHVAYIVRTCYSHGREVIYVTARGHNEWELQATADWLMDNRMWFAGVQLFGRQVGDNRDDVVFKLETFNNHIRGKYDVKLWLDDRPKVCRMVQELGIPLLANQAYIRGEF